ncbi:MAG: hydantoinase B/oxoprolinase family protein, partial [Pseudonocardia sp.]|nr:hydantoinase B/oxoprolinase family protein [Pseudonocardia sp.]
ARIGFGSTATTDIYAEGLQLRSIKVLKAGRWDADVMQILSDNIRMPESSLGDLRAAIAACRLGERRMVELADRYGLETVLACVDRMRDQSERLSRDAVARMADGEYTAASWMDNDGQNLDQPIKLDIRVEVAGEELTIDFSDIAEQVQGPLNSGRSGGVAAARVAFKALTLPTHPVDEGSFRNLHVILPEGKLLNARPPAALGQWSISLPTVVDTIVKALAPALPDKVPAGHKGDMSGFTFYGLHQRTGTRFVSLNINGGGWGGRPSGDGPSACVSVCQGDVRNIPIEILESRYPLVFSRHELRADSGGAGRHRGGLGLDIEAHPQQVVFTNIANERTSCPPWGLHGGQPGAVNDTIVAQPGAEAMHVKKHTGFRLEAGSSITFRTAGGGGWGDPFERPVAEVVEDVLDGLVTTQAARDQYGVALSEDGEVDRQATDDLRKARDVAGR